MIPFRKILLLALLLGLCLTKTSYAILRLNGANDQDYIDYGNTFDSVVALAYTNEQGRWSRGSCIVIDDGHWVLTAAHCIMDETSWPRQPIGFRFTAITGPDPWDMDGRECFASEQWWVHPDYVSISQGPDIALLYFEEPITGLTPATRFRGTDVLNSTISIVGYGDAGTPATGWLDGVDQTDDNVRRGCKAPIQYGLGTNINAGAGFWSTGGFLNGKAAHGDSGGGWFIDVDGQQQLMAIASTISGGSDYGVTWGLRVSLYNDWIDEIQATFVPEPSTVLLLLAGTCMLFFFYRKRNTRHSKPENY